MNKLQEAKLKNETKSICENIIDEAKKLKQENAVQYFEARVNSLLSFKFRRGTSGLGAFNYELADILSVLRWAKAGLYSGFTVDGNIAYYEHGD